MSLDHLKKNGHLRDESEWPHSHACSPIHPTTFLTTTLIGLAGCALMAVGNGGLWTWFGLALFLVALVAFLRTNLRSIGRPTTRPAAQAVPEPTPDDAPPRTDLE